MNVILFSLYCLLSYLSLVMLNLLLCECHLVFPLLSFVILITCYVKFAPMWMSSCFPLLSFVILITCYVKYAPMWMSSCLPSIFFFHTYHLLCYVCSYVNVILFSLYCLLSYFLTFYVKIAPMRMSSCLSSIVFCHTYHLLC